MSLGNRDSFWRLALSSRRTLALSCGEWAWPISAYSCDYNLPVNGEKIPIFQNNIYGSNYLQAAVGALGKLGRELRNSSSVRSAVLCALASALKEQKCESPVSLWNLTIYLFCLYLRAMKQDMKWNSTSPHCYRVLPGKCPNPRLEWSQKCPSICIVQDRGCVLIDWAEPDTDLSSSLHNAYQLAEPWQSVGPWEPRLQQVRWRSSSELAHSRPLEESRVKPWKHAGWMCHASCPEG